MTRKTYWAVIAVLAVPFTSCTAKRQDVPARAAAEQATAEEPAPAHASRLPPDGDELFAFLLKEIPDVVSEIECTCCGKKLADCFHGACPGTCGPCNQLGREAWELHEQGLSKDEIVHRMHDRYFKTRL